MAKIEVKNIKKRFGETKALDGVSLSVKEGSILGLLGPNGAGKTTLVNVLTTLLVPDSGKATVAGHDVVKDPDAVRKSIGLAGQYAAVDENLTGRENLTMVGRLYHMPRAEVKKRVTEVLERINLTDAADRPVKTYSGGMRRRLDLGASLIYIPDVLFLDEPTTGLDPKTRMDLWKLIREIVNDGTTLLLTTQYLQEADELADKIVVIDRGRVIAEGTSSQLKKKIGGDKLVIEIAKQKNLEDAKNALQKVTSHEVIIEKQTNTISMSVDHGLEDMQKALDLLKKHKISVEHINLARPSLDDVFLQLTGEDDD